MALALALSGGLQVASLYDRKVDVRLSDVVDEVGEDVLGDDADDLDDLRVAVPSLANGRDVIAADLAARLGDLGGELQGGGNLASPDLPCRFNAASSGLILARFSPI